MRSNAALISGSHTNQAARVIVWAKMIQIHQLPTWWNRRQRAGPSHLTALSFEVAAIANVKKYAKPPPVKVTALKWTKKGSGYDCPSATSAKRCRSCDQANKSPTWRRLWSNHSVP